MKSGIIAIYPRIPLFTAFMLFTITFFVYNDFGIRMIFGYAVLAYAALAYLIFRSNYIRMSKGKALYLILALSMSILPIMGRNESSTGVFVIAVVLCAVVAVIGDVRRSDFIIAFKILIVSSVLIALYVIAVKLVPSLYTNGTRRLISSESQTINDQLMRDGYGVTLGGNVVFIDYVLIMAGLLVFNILLAYKRSLKYKWAYWGFFGICAVGMLFVNRKSEMLAYLIAVLFCYWKNMNFSTVKERRNTRRRAIVMVAFAFAALAYMASRGYLNRYMIFITRILNNMQGTGAQTDVTSGRTFLWSLALSLFLEHPLFGIGWGNFRDYLPISLSHLNNVHNNYIQLLCETGIVGFLMIMVPMVMVFVQTIRTMEINRLSEYRDPLLTAVNLTSLGMQISFFVISFLDPCLYKMSFWPFYAIAMMLSFCSESFVRG